MQCQRSLGLALLAALVAGVGWLRTGAGSEPQAVPPLPRLLSQTGLLVPGSTAIAPGALAFSPQYPLWSDGTTKRRWLQLPPGTWIDGAQPEAWVFPPGTRLWKEFSYGRPVETRLVERLADGSWRFATYVWNSAGSDAELAPPEGNPAWPVAAAPDGRYTILAEADCRACHEASRVPALGFSALQLSSDRDPLAPHRQPRLPGEADLQTLVTRGWLRNLPPPVLATPPRIVAASATERAALGYLHGNCGHCHDGRTDSPLPVKVTLAQSLRADGSAAALASMLGASSDYRLPEAAAATRVVAPGQPEKSVLLLRMRSRNPLSQMPPLGTRLPDAEAVALVERWIKQQDTHGKDPKP